MGVFCLFVGLHQERSAPAACAVGLFSLYLENTYDVEFLFSWEQKKIHPKNSVIKKTVIWYAFFSCQGLKPKSIQLGTPRNVWPFKELIPPPKKEF